MSDTCRSCDAPIVWALTHADKSMPVDADPHPDGNVVLTPGPIRPHAEVLGPLEQVIDDGRPRHRSHFATCPQADAWRQR